MPNTPKTIEESLHEFKQHVGIIISLEEGGKYSPEEAYKKLKKLWKTLKKSKKNLDES